MAENDTPTTTEENTPEEDKGPLTSKIYNSFLKRPAIGGSCIYIFVSSVGVIYSWVLFREFQINIFDFAETNDFLLIAFKEPLLFLVPLIIILSGLIIPYIYKYSSGFSKYLFNIIMLNIFKLISETKVSGILESLTRGLSTPFDSFVRYVTSSVSYVYILGGILLMFYLPYNGAKNFTAAHIKQKEPTINLVYEEGKQSSTSVIKLKSILIGSTEKFMFFYVRSEDHASEGRTIIIPISKIISITTVIKQEQKKK